MSTTAKSIEITTNCFIFPDYQKGKVYFKNNKVVESLLNYQIVVKEMLFKQNEQILSLGLPQTTDSIVIAGRVFVFYDDKEFFEKIALSKGNLYTQYHVTLLSKGKAAGYGGYSQVSSVTSIGSLSSTDNYGGEMSANRFSTLSPNEQYSAKIDSVFYIKRDDKFIKVATKNQVFKAFSEHKQVIQSYFINHKVDFSSLNDVKTLLNFCFSL